MRQQQSNIAITVKNINTITHNHIHTHTHAWLHLVWQSLRMCACFLLFTLCREQQTGQTDYGRGNLKIKILLTTFCGKLKKII